MEVARRLSLAHDVMKVVWSPDGKLLATLEGFATTIEIWDVASGKLVTTITKQPDQVFTILFTPDSKYLIIPPVTPYDGVARTALAIVDVRTGRTTRTINGPNDPSRVAFANQPRGFSLSPDGKLLYVTFNTLGRPNTQDRTVHIYDTATGLEAGSIPDFGYLMLGGPGDDELTTIDPFGAVRVWATREKRVLREMSVMQSPDSMALSPLACLLAVSSGPKAQTPDKITGKLEAGWNPQVWNLTSGELVSVGAIGQLVRGLSFSPDAKRLTATTGDNSVLAFEVADLKKVQRVGHFVSNAPQTAFSPDGRYLAAAGSNQIVLYTAE